MAKPPFGYCEAPRMASSFSARRSRRGACRAFGQVQPSGDIRSSSRRISRGGMFPHASVVGLGSGAGGGSALTGRLRGRHLRRGLCGRFVIAKATDPCNHR